ncbi:MAG: hypothetical protein KGQ60_12925 [Planctomycetes bacterium]|nr:hypothetical protein [Planctomycetota bacterium]
MPWWPDAIIRTSDLSIDDRLYRVDPRGQGMKVYVLYDPYRINGDTPDDVSVSNDLKVFLGIEIRWNRERGGHGPGTQLPTKPKPPDPSAAPNKKIKLFAYLHFFFA